MSLPATDNFNRADAITLGANWTFAFRASGSEEFYVASNQASAIWPVGTASYWSADAFNADHYSQAKPTGTRNSGPAVRVSSGQAYILTQIDKRLYKITGSSSYTLLTSWGTETAGDVLKLEAAGSDLTVYRNGSSVATASDSALTTGAAGIWAWDTTIDDWEGGNLGGGGGARVVFARPARVVRRSF